MKATAIAPANIAFIKYWGNKDDRLRLPDNGSISMNLSNLLTTTTVEFQQELFDDDVVIDGKQEKNATRRVSKQLDLIRRRANIQLKAKVVSHNNFPSSTGLSSSASGFAALTVAACKAIGLTLSEKELSILARQGSGSAARSIPAGFVEWCSGKTSEQSYAASLYPADYWDIVDIVAIVSREKKETSTTKGHALAHSSPFFSTRLATIDTKIQRLKEFLATRDFSALGELVEDEALELHAIMLTSKPSLLYWLPATIQIMRLVRYWRKEGLEVFFTVNTGQDIHLICEGKNVERVKTLLRTIEEVNNIIVNKPSAGARIIRDHLF